jgi:dynein light intermediate chain
MPGPTQDTLVKFDTPSLISSSAGGLAGGKKRAGAAGGSPVGKTLPGAAQPRAGKLPPMDSKPAASQTEDILNSILPPREWNEEGQLWIQYVSPAPATRLDVISLQEQLDQKLKERQARETGICPIRQELYAQCFGAFLSKLEFVNISECCPISVDELIRQVTVNCSERGLLLHRVRDEMRMTLAAYQTLYESAIAFGMRKALQAEQGKAELEAKASQLDGEKRDLERQVSSLLLLLERWRLFLHSVGG